MVARFVLIATRRLALTDLKLGDWHRKPKMADVTAGFELGTAGNTLTTGDTGDATAYNTVAIGSGTTLVYSTDQAKFGSQSMKCQQTGGAGNIQFDVSSITDTYGRFYLYRSAVPSGTLHQLIRFQNTGSFSSYIAINHSTGRLYIRDVSAAKTATGTVSIATSQWIRIEYHLVTHASTGSLEVKLFNSPDSTTATETISFTAGNTLSAIDTYRIGNISSMTDGPWYMDQILLNATSYPGPYIPPSTSDAKFLGMF